MSLFFDPNGPLITYRDQTFYVSDLNPQIDTQWRMSRWEMCVLGWRCIWAAIKG